MSVLGIILRSDSGVIMSHQCTASCHGAYARGWGGMCVHVSVRGIYRFIEMIPPASPFCFSFQITSPNTISLSVLDMVFVDFNVAN